mmetsp:Transcript_61495/g.129763  ORF Transcript_61495/g.129763 Transcript_61495/m.129763 type:complete len:253 (+) Transcript_61495:782-1540(+)
MAVCGHGSFLLALRPVPLQPLPVFQRLLPHRLEVLGRLFPPGKRDALGPMVQRDSIETQARLPTLSLGREVSLGIFRPFGLVLRDVEEVGVVLEHLRLPRGLRRESCGPPNDCLRSAHLGFSGDLRPSDTFGVCSLLPWPVGCPWKARTKRFLLACHCSDFDFGGSFRVRYPIAMLGTAQLAESLPRWLGAKAVALLVVPLLSRSGDQSKLLPAMGNVGKARRALRLRKSMGAGRRRVDAFARNLDHRRRAS